MNVPFQRPWLLCLLIATLSACKPSQANVSFIPASPSSDECSAAQPADFWEAFSSLNFEAAAELAPSESERKFAAYAQSVALPTAMPLRKLPLPSEETDTLVRDQWANVSQSIDWLTEKYAQAAKGPDPSTAALSAAFATRPLRNIVYAQDEFQVPLYASSTNSPMVDVEIDGQTFRFWLDTGAGVSVISSQVAFKTGIRSLSDEASEVNTSTRHVVSASPAVIDSFSLGQLKVYNHACVILDKRDLTFRFLGIRLLKIDGIIGWPLLKLLDLEFDMPGGVLTVRRPKYAPHERPSYTLGWFWQPFLQCPTANGCTLNLQIDTGSNTTFFHPSAYQKLGLQPSKGGSSVRGGAGGKELVPYDRLDTCRFELGEHGVTLNYAEGIKDDFTPDKLFRFDGVLGQDVLSKGRFRMDFANRLYGFWLE